MKMNLLKFSALSLLALSSVSAVYADPVKETANVTIVNNFSDIFYSIFDYTTSGNASFTTKPDQILPLKSVTTEVFLDPVSSAGFKFKALNNPECIVDPEKLLGHCYELKVTNISDTNPLETCPKVELWDNLNVSNGFQYICTPGNNHVDLTIYVDNKQP